MSFPQTPLDIQVDLKIDGAWTGSTSDVYRRDAIRISRGRSNEEGQIGPGSCELTLNNRSGKYSPRNPTGIYYGKIGPNTPIRVSVNHGDPYLDIADTDGDRATTADHASLDITGDIDVRVDAVLDDWLSSELQFLMGKYGSSGRSWVLSVSGGFLLLRWTTAGSPILPHIETSTERMELPGTRRLAVRATLDVDNGASGHTVTFYTAPDISGTWTQLGDPVIVSGTTSIHSGAASLDVGFVGNDVSHLAPVGQILAAEVRSGIGGSVVANPDWTAQVAGTTSFADGAGRTWTLAGNATISNRQTRFLGEVTSWPIEWDTSGNDIYTPIQAAGILRRLGQGDEAIQSAMRREFGNPARRGVVPYGSPGPEGIVAYWPCEDGNNASLLTSAHENEPGMVITGSMNLAAYSDWPASDPLPSLGTDSFATGQLPFYEATGHAATRCFFFLPQAVGSQSTLLDIVTTGTAKTWTVRVDTSGDLKLQAFDAEIGLLFESSSLSAAITGKKIQIAVELTVNGADIEWTLRSIELDSAVVENTLSGTLSSETFGRITEVRVGAAFGLSGAAFGHVAVASADFAFAGTNGALIGNDGEAASTRMFRLAGEEDIPLILINKGDDEPVGAQKSAELLQLMRDAADVGHGFLYEARHVLALQYRGLPTLYNQTPVAALTYSTDLMPSLRSTDDDLQTRNHVAVQRVDGAWGYASETEGRLSVALPPAGAGRYPTQLTRNLHTDEQPAQHAAWYVNLGTVDELRYPVVRVAVQAAPSVAQQMMALDVGDRLQILDPTTKLPPGEIDLLAQGYTETLAQFEWDFELNCSPASPYTVVVLDDDDLGRLDTDGSTLGAAATSTATTLVVHTTQTADGLVPIWTEDAGDYAMDLRVGGEVVTATAATSLAEDDFNRTVGAGGWGTASDGHTYTLTGGVSSSERSVASNRGLVTVSASQTLHRQQTVSETCTDADVRCQMAVSATATGGTLNACVLLRWSSSTAHYRARVEFTTGGTVSVSVTVGSTIIDTNASTGLSYAPGDVFEVRVRIIGYRILMRVWPTGTAEPTVWHIDRTDVSNTHASGTVGLSAHGGSGNSNVGVEYRFDNFEVVTPQRMTVTRSVNGVVKAQAAGEDIRLAVPTILAL